MLQAVLRDLDEFLGTFVDQPAAATLVVSCEDMASGIVHAVVEGFDERREEDVGVVLSAPVEDIDSYVSELARTLREALREADESSAAAELPTVQRRPEPTVQRRPEPPEPTAQLLPFENADLCRRSERAADPEPARHSPHAEHSAPTDRSGAAAPFERPAPPPLGCADPREAELFAAAEDLAQSPEDRVEALIQLLLRRLPEGDHRLLLALNPARITDHSGYRALVRGLLALRAPRLRLVLRDERPPAHLPGDEPLPPGHHLFDLPVDFDLLVASVRATSTDPGRPLHERIAALLQLGFYEQGHGAPEEAELCFLAVLDELSRDEASAQRPGAPPRPGAQRSALALYGLGTLRAEQGRPAEAKELLLRAWGSARGSDPVTKASIALSLGETLAAEGAPEPAAVFLALAATHASEAGAQQLAASSLRTLGELQLRLGLREEARDAWALGRRLLDAPRSTLAQELDRLLRSSSSP